MKGLKLEIDLFDMTDKQIEASKMMYNGKIIKCLVAPYHTFSDIEQALPFSKNTFVYPEREMNINQIKSLISMIVENPNIQDARIVTKDQNIIIDMVDDCVRVLTESGEIVNSPSKTLMANIHDIRYNLLENEAHQLSNKEKEQGVAMVNELITTCKKFEGKTMPEDDFKKLQAKIQMVGEDLIRNILEEQLHLIKVVPSSKSVSNKKSEMQKVSEEVENLSKNMNNMTSDEFDKEYARLNAKMKLLQK